MSIYWTPMSSTGIILLQLIFILLGAKLGGWIAEKLKQPTVLGELIVGIILGTSVLGILQPYTSGSLNSSTVYILTFLAELGAILLLFEVGLESNIYQLMKVGMASFFVAIIGVIVPMVLTYGILVYIPYFHYTSTVAFFIGATLTATSVGVTMRVLKDFQKVNSNEGKIILGAAVIDDILGLIILSLVVSIVEVGKVSLLHIGKISGWAIIFLTGSLFMGIKLLPFFQKVVYKLNMKRTFVVSSLCLIFLLAWIADYIGLATIVGAFAAGLILETTPHKEFIKDRFKPMNAWLVPIFFVMAGSVVNIKAFAHTKYLPLLGVLIAIAVFGKYVAKWGVRNVAVNKTAIGLGMIPRGEVGLIFAAYGVNYHIITTDLYSILVMVIMLTTLITPPLLTWSLTRDVKNHPSQMGGIKGKCLACHPTTTVVLNTSGIPEGVSPRGSLISSEKERNSRRMKKQSVKSIHKRPLTSESEAL